MTAPRPSTAAAAGAGAGRRRLEAADQVLVGRKLLEAEASPVVGGNEVHRWDLAALGRPANRPRSWGILSFDPLTDTWLSTAKLLAVLCLSPSHPVFVDAGVQIRHRPQSPPTASKYIDGLKALQESAVALKMPAALSTWKLAHFDRAYRHIAAHGSDTRHDHVVATLKRIHQYRHIFDFVAYRGTPVAVLAKARHAPDSGPLKTQPVEPLTWRTTLHAAITYVTCFSDDILAARAERERLTAFHQRGSPQPNVVDRYLARKGTLIPVRRAPTPSDNDLGSLINWRLLSVQISQGTSDQVFTGNKPAMRLRRSYAEAKVRLGEWTTAGLYQPRQHLPGRDTPWIDSLDGARLIKQEAMLRAAAYIVIAALTMMRDSEVQELRRGCITTKYGIPAVQGVRVKGRTHRPEQHWWINDTVAEAILLLEKLNPDSDQLFTSVRRADHGAVGFQAGTAIVQFIRHVNTTAAATGLPPIPTEDVTPHMLRRTMAMLAAQEPHGEIAAGIQLGHTFRRAMAGALTAGYTAEHRRWSSQFLTKQAEQAAQELAAAITADGVDQLRGPGAGRIVDLADPTIADEGMKRRLLQHFPDLTVGTFNLCLGDRSVARCLNAATDAKHPLLLEQCQPDRCANSVITGTQQEAWQQDLDTVESFLRQRRLAPQLREQLTARKRVLQQALQEPERRLNDPNESQSVRPRRGEHHQRDEAPP